ncbi:MAG: hypothetical protein HYX47_01135 [Burkholderiales bacterium]|nr:hypothetical protein [Burkholderiales bacterium]
MNNAPRSYLTPADRDAAMIEASKLRAMSLRHEDIERWVDAGARLARRLGHGALQALARTQRRAHWEV